MVVTTTARDSRTTGAQAAAARFSSLVTADAGCSSTTLPDISHDVGIGVPQCWVRPMTDVDSSFSVPMPNMATSTSNPPVSAALAHVIHRV